MVKMSRYHQGFFRPRKPEKYKGNPSNIVYRSGLELKLFMYLDNHKQVVRWASEEQFMVVTYVNPVTGKSHRYFPDAWFEKRGTDGKIKTFLVEVKPHAQTIPPIKKNGKATKTFTRAVMVYATNTKKWEAARNICSKKGWEFKIISEKHLK